jgi:hypothetical protein
MKHTFTKAEGAVDNINRFPLEITDKINLPDQMHFIVLRKCHKENEVHQRRCGSHSPSFNCQSD